MNLSSGDPQPIISNVALGPSALGQHWKLLASAHHLIKPQYGVDRSQSLFYFVPQEKILTVKLARLNIVKEGLPVGGDRWELCRSPIELFPEKPFVTWR